MNTVDTLAGAVELFLDGYRETTRRSYAEPLKQLSAYIGPARPLADIRPVDLDAYVKRSLAKPERGLAPATVQKHIKTIRTFFNWCVRVELLEASPFKVRSSRLKRKVSSEDVLQDWQLEQLLAYASWHPRLYALVLFLADTGARRGGAAGLRVDDLDLANKRAIVTEKGDKTRPVFYSAITATAISDWLTRRGQIGGYVFSKDGKPISAASIAQCFRRGCIAAGIGSHGPHKLRHRKGNQLARARVDPTTAANLLGHEDPSITMQYYYNSDWQMVEDVARQLEVKADPRGKLKRFG